ncbi:MFS transporter [Amantichitinum ursilacus]|uniref:Major Facilitator Superfamily protein n=1 Tax=Amantichitinum ursilacus TaxID=857265 RepID=A0A0N1JRI6_9NEIS|nr:MFS transporter [Amantichitinum ursilacus]KPC49611.1 Major Facilitator Superfamily protein [Amantichitinum ursilacus]
MSQTAAPAEVRRFVFAFAGLSLISGITIGMNKILGTLLGLQLAVTPWQLGVISGAETLALALGTLPAGRLLGRGDPRVGYAVVSLLLAAVFVLLPRLGQWQWVALAMFAAGLCISFRIVAMSTVFLLQLPRIGQAKAGWYKGSLTLGIQFAGPLIASYFTAQLGLTLAFGISAALFVLLALLGWLVLPADTGAPRNAARAGLRQVLQLAEVRRVYLFEVLGSMTASAWGVFAILLAVRLLHWSAHNAVWLVALQGISYVAVLFFGGRWLLGAASERWYQTGHALILAGLLLAGLFHSDSAFVLAALAFGFGLGFNNLINFSRLAQAPVDKASVSAHLTLFQMLGSAAGAMGSGWLGSHLGLQAVFLLWTAPWIITWPGWLRVWQRIARTPVVIANKETA